MSRGTYQSRRWCGTYFHQSQDFDPGASILEWCEYFCYAEEFAESTGSRHSQFYLYTKTKKTMSGVLKLLEKHDYKGAHLEPAHGTHAESITYINGPYEKKDKHGTVIKFKPLNETFKDYGERPMESGDKTQADWENVRKLAREGKFDEIDAKYDVCFTRNLRFLHQEARRATHLEEPCGIFIWGRSGAGKSHLARAHNDFNEEDTFLKNFNKFWCSYRNESLVILDDADPTKVKGLDQELKIWTDRYAFAPENKGGHTGKIRPKTFIITSQYSMKQLFTDEETYWAMRRRCIVIKCWVDKEGTHKTHSYPRLTKKQCEEKKDFADTEEPPAIAESFVMSANEKDDGEFWAKAGTVWF